MDSIFNLAGVQDDASTAQSNEAALHITSGADARDWLEVVDALYRFGAGQDLRDERLFASAFADEAKLDFVQPAARLGVTLPVMHGKARIVSAVMSTIARLTTTHTVSNPRVWINGDKADLFALVKAQHLPSDDHRRRLMLENVYRARLCRGEPGWLIDHLRIDNIWFTGDPAVLFPSKD